MTEPIAEVDSAILRACASSAASRNPVLLAVRYHLSQPGNQLRARLCLDACTRLGISAADAMAAATTCELLHNASLLHDDLMDRSPRRRGQESTWSRFGDGVAVCAGDLMLSAAYASLHSITPATLVPELAKLVHTRTQDLICGQADDLQTAASPFPVEQYRVVAIAKSAPLISLALELPLTLAALRPAMPLAQEVAASFAVAYQIADDLDDVEEDKRANCLNVVQVLATACTLSDAEARRAAQAKAEEQMEEVIALAQQLPMECGAVLTDHVAVLRAKMRAGDGAAASVGR